ncbi:hypothetical protein F4818DRAFT_456969, partial [Hypoxylon cercidicola]
DSRTDKTVKCKKGRTPISYASSPICFTLSRCFEVGNPIGLLLNMTNLDPDESDFEGKTPLMYACESWSNFEISALLETGKVDVNAKDKRGWTPMWYILKGGNFLSGGDVLKSVRQLLASKAMDPLVIVDGWKMLDFAEEKFGNETGITALLSSYVEEWIECC